MCVTLTVNYPLRDKIWLGQRAPEVGKPTEEKKFPQALDAIEWLSLNPGWSSYILVGTSL